MAPWTRRITILVAVSAAIAWQPAAATAQGRGGGAGGDAAVPEAFMPGTAPQLMDRLPNIMPLNDLPDPTTPEDNWVRLPDGRTWGSTAGADIDPDGIHIWAIDRCGENSCAGSDLDPLLKITPDGEVVESFGGGMINFPHGLYVDDEGNVWVTDGSGPEADVPGSAGKGHTVLKFSPTGELLLTIGTPGVAGDGTGALLNEPNDVTTDADGNIYVADGHSGQGFGSPPETVARIAVYDENGSFLRTFGRLGAAPGEFRTPHAIDVDSQGRLIIGDRGNNRIVIMQTDGTYIGELRQFGRPSGIYITDDDMLYVADSESRLEGSNNPGWANGIRFGSLRDGIVRGRIAGRVEAYPNDSNPEGVAVDAAGNVYGAVVSGGGAFIKNVPD
jgi:sugar lactone lactonase YvrE